MTMRRSAENSCDGGLEQGGVLAGGLGVVNGAGADEDEQARVAAVEDGGDFVAGVEDGGRGGFGDGALFLKEYRGKDNFGPLDAEIFSGVEHGWLPWNADWGLWFPP